MTWQPLRHVADVAVSNVDKKSSDDEVAVRLVNYTDVYYGDRLSPELGLMDATASAEQVRQFRLRPDDVVITKDSETADDIGVAAFVETSAPDMVCGYHLAVLRPRPALIVGRYLYWSMVGDDARGQLETAATGVTRFGLRQDSIRSLSLWVPPLVTQRAIAEYLDTETARIDALIAKKGRMIELLDERLLANIEYEFVRDTRRVLLRRLLSSPPQYGAGLSGEGERPGWIRYVRITDLTSDGQLRDDDPRFISPEQARPYLLVDGDVLVARSGATSGKSFLFKRDFGPASYAGYLIRLRLDPSLLKPGLAYWWMQTSDYWGQIRSSAVRATIENVNAERYKELLVPVPETAHQGRALQRIESLAASRQRATSKLTRQTALLAEHRQALITAAVTGDLEIPGVAA